MELLKCRVSALLPAALSVVACRAQPATCPAWSQLRWPAHFQRRTMSLSDTYSASAISHRQYAAASGSSGDMHTADMDPRARAILQFWYV
jgi:hypothetical protein